MSDAYTRPIIDDPAGASVASAPAVSAQHGAAEPASDAQPRWGGDLRFMLVVLAAIVALFLAFALLIAFSPTGAASISLALRQVKDARAAADAADARARAAEASARESDAWAAQMESGLRVGVAKLKAAGQDTRDVERAAGTPDEFF
jgi:hypothetical protein